MSEHSEGRSRILKWSFGLVVLSGVCIVTRIWWLQQRAPQSPEPPPTAHQPQAEGPHGAVEKMDDPAKFLHLMNLAKAYLETSEYSKAIETLDAVLVLRPQCIEAQRNLARAYLFSGKPETALKRLEEVRKNQPGSAATLYLTGVALARLSRFDDAIPPFEQAVALDANTAAIRYQLASAYESVGQRAKAVEQLEETARLDHGHSAAQYRLAMHARDNGQMDESRRRLRNYIRLRDLYGEPSNTPLALEACIHTAAEPAASEISTDAAPPSGIEVRFTDATDDVFEQPTDRSAAAVAVIDMDENGRYTLFVVNRDGGLSLLTAPASGKFERTPLALKLPPQADIRGCVVGNFHDKPAEEADKASVSGLYTDVFVIGESGAYLLLRTSRDSFQDVTQSAGLADLSGHAARWVDYEYDGDLDLLVASRTGLQLWQNNGNGTFSNVTAEVGIPNAIDCVDVEAVDWDSNGAVDFVAALGAEPTLVFQNLRAGRLVPMPQPPGPWPNGRRVLANDVNNDGYPDVLLAGEKQVEIILGQNATRPRIDLADSNVEATALIDYDNDGWLDLCGVGHSSTRPDEGRIRLWRNGGVEDWADVTDDCGLGTAPGAPLRDVIAADLDTDGDTDLLLLTEDSQLQFLRNDGGHVNGQLKVRLLSLLIGNRGGIGTEIELRAGDYCANRWVQREWPVEIGLNSRTRLDSVRTVWSDGVVRSQIMVEPTRQPLDFVISEFVSTGSCPYLYVWDGQNYSFVTDLLGGAALGVPISRQDLEPVNPHELVVIGEADRFQPRDGAYTIKITNEQREADYLDYFKLLAVDHPRHVEVHSSSMLAAPPFLPPQVRALSNPIPPVRAEGDDGIDRTVDVREEDGVFAAPGRTLPPPLRGVCRPLSLTLDFDRIPTDRRLVLALTGWLQYGTSSSNIALSQNSSVQVIRPVLEAETADGDWVVLDVVLGLPAGKTKTILCDLAGRLPMGAKRLRLTTTQEIRWDRIVLCEDHGLDTLRIHEIEFGRGDVSWRGFSDMRVRAQGHPPSPDYSNAFGQPPWYAAVQGWYTRYGDVSPLISDADGRSVLLNGGDVLTLRTDFGDLPPVPNEMSRTFLLYSVGWNKECDPNTVNGDRVEPLPGPTPAAVADEKNDWRLRYNTRWVAPDHFHPTRLQR